ncbi:MAG: M23 family metallopeptidase [bacterium]|nr:M23 family metallopeptidase [bacterium]
MLKKTSALPRNRSRLILFKRRLLRFQKHLLTSFEELKSLVVNVRQGSRLSRPFRHLFNQRRIKTILGGNLALLVLISSVYSPSVSALGTMTQTDRVVLSPGAVELTTKQSLRLPVESLRITQNYSFFHSGVDLDGVTGDPIYPIMDGTVLSVIFSRFGLGKHIIIAHGSGMESVYGHLSKIEVNVGDKVSTNQVIGRMGNTGRSFGDHLHLEIFDNGRRINPASILPLNQTKLATVK